MSICSAAELLGSPPVSFASRATTEMDRVVAFVLMVENVTDRKAAWYWAGVALPLKVKTPPEYVPLIPAWLVKLSKSPDWKLLIVIEAPVRSVS